MDLGTLITLGEYGLKAAIEVGCQLKNQYPSAVNDGIEKAFQLALDDWSKATHVASDILRLNAALDGYTKNATSYEALDKDTKDFIDCFKKRLSEQQKAHNYLMTLRADEQAKSEELNLQEHRKTQVLIQNFMAQMSGSYMNLQDISELFKELPLNQGVESIKSTLEKMRSEGRIPSEEAKKSLLEIALHKFEYSNEISKEATQLRIAGDKPLAETFEEINRVLTGDSEQSLTAIYEKLKEQEHQNEVKALEELIEAAQIQFSFGEAREFYERLIELSPTIKNHFDYARMLQSLNDFGKARSHYEEALQALRELVEKDSEAYKPDLAGTLNNLGNSLYHTNDLKQARAYYEEARLIYQELAEKNPEAYKPYLATTLNNLGNLLYHTNELKQAIAYYEEARLIYKELAEKNPEAYKPDLAMTLNNITILYLQLGKKEEAEWAYQEAYTIYQELANLHSKADEINYAKTLVTGGIMLGRPLENLKEAKEILSKYPEHPEAQGLLSSIEEHSKRVR